MTTTEYGLSGKEKKKKSDKQINESDQPDHVTSKKHKREKGNPKNYGNQTLQKQKNVADITLNESSDFNQTGELKQNKKAKNLKYAPDFNSKKNIKLKPFGKKNAIKGAKVSESKPVWKEFKKEKKTLKLARKQKKSTSYDTGVKVKKLWEQLRRSDCSLDARENLISQIHSLLENRLHEVIYTHDITRVVQWIIKMGKPEIRQKIVQELKPHFLNMIQSKYSSFCVKRLLLYGSHDARNTIIESFYGHVVQLMSHSYAAPVVEYAYSTWASSTQKCYLRQEFYGNMFKADKDINVKSLSTVFENNPALKDGVLEATKSNITKILNKKLVNSSLFHAVLHDYLSNCSQEDQRDTFTLLHGYIHELIATKEGTRVVMMAFWYGTNKDRKVYIKALKGHVKDVAVSEHGHMALLALFDSIDDTVLLKKILFPELIGELKTIASSEHGRRVLLYLIAHRNPLYFHPAVVEILKQGDKSETSKKDPALRESELLDGIIAPLLQSISEDPQHWLHNNSICMVTLAALRSGKGEKLREAFESISSFIVNPENVIKEGDVDYRAIEHSGLHLMLKKLIQNEEKLDCGEAFTPILVSKVDQSTVDYWTSYNRGCFVLIIYPGFEEFVQNNIDGDVSDIEFLSDDEKDNNDRVNILQNNFEYSDSDQNEDESKIPHKQQDPSNGSRCMYWKNNVQNFEPLPPAPPSVDASTLGIELHPFDYFTKYIPNDLQTSTQMLQTLP